jgi:hypothetical protein
MDKLRLENTLNEWVEWWNSSGSEKSNERLHAAAQRAEKELEQYFGPGALEQLKSSTSGDGRLIFEADGLIEAFLGKRAAMAVTRKLYSNLP